MSQAPRGAGLDVSWRGNAAAENVQCPTFDVQRSRPNSLFKNSCSPREGTRPTIFPRESACVVALTGRLFQQALTNPGAGPTTAAPTLEVGRWMLEVGREKFSRRARSLTDGGTPKRMARLWSAGTCPRFPCTVSRPAAMG